MQHITDNYSTPKLELRFLEPGAVIALSDGVTVADFPDGWEQEETWD